MAGYSKKKAVRRTCVRKWQAGAGRKWHYGNRNMKVETDGRACTRKMRIPYKIWLENCLRTRESFVYINADKMISLKWISKGTDVDWAAATSDSVLQQTLTELGVALSRQFIDLFQNFQLYHRGSTWHVLPFTI
jgi:hypothetical protein